MLDLASMKKVVMIADNGITNGATSSGYVDTKGFDYAVIDVITSTASAASVNCSVLNISEGDTTSSFATIAGCVGDASGGFTVASAQVSAAGGATTLGPVVTFQMDLRGRKRYIKATASPTTTQCIVALCTLGRAEQYPVGTTAQISDVVVNV